MHLFVNALGASAGAGLTYLYNVVPCLSSQPNVCTTLAVQPQLREEFSSFANVDLADAQAPGGAARRFWFEQQELPAIIRRSGADVLMAAGNFALRNSPVPQILLSGNSLYTSSDFYRDLRARGAYWMWLDTRLKGILARNSVRWADCTVAPSAAFAEELQGWTGKKVIAIHHGFDPEVFFGDKSPLPLEIQEKLEDGKDSLRLLFVSHYNYYRNFETLFRAIALLRQGGRKVQLFLTCRLQDKETPGTYKTEGAAALVRQLGIEENVVELGAIPYRHLHQVYRRCDLYVTPAYTETFAHPLVEAMASGLPIVASDLAVHREVCGDSAVYFSRFSPQELANRILRVMSERAASNRPDARSGQFERFSWSNHVRQIISVAAQLADPCRSAVRHALAS
jgi:glycosyltransferase involved in cell wall biosynthesis